MVAAPSTKEHQPGALSVARGKQVSITNWQMRPKPLRAGWQCLGFVFSAPLFADELDPEWQVHP